MKLFGYEITKALVPPMTGGGFRGRVHEPFTGAWQKGIEYSTDSVVNNPTLWRCVNLIASDVGKMPIRLSTVTDDIWTETDNPAFSPVLRKPNRFQTRQNFFEQWLHSKLMYGNTYALKRRDNRNVVIELFILDPNRVTVLIAPSGDVWYDLRRDDLSGVGEQGLQVPASEIIHDKFNALHHPLIGLSPITAAGLSAYNGLEIANSAAKFWSNGARPGGILVAPGPIGEDTAREMKTFWEQNFTGSNSGKLAVFGDDLKYVPLATNAVDSALIDQLRFSAETICSVFGVPKHLVGVGEQPTYNNVAVLSQQYYSQCLQPYIEAIELSLDEGLSLPKGLHVEFQLDSLIRMDEQTLTLTLKEAVGAGIMAPNEARRRLNLKPVAGGETPYLQQQNFGLQALAERDADKPFAKPEPTPAPQPTNDNEADLQAAKALAVITKGLAHV